MVKRNGWMTGLRGLLLIGLVAMTCPQLVWGQKVSGSISGTVVDSSGALVPGAAIVITNVDTNVTVFQGATDDAGRYVAPSVQPGNYTIKASRTGFGTEARLGVVLLVNQDATIDFTLHIGAVTQTVEVVGGAPLLTTQSATLSDVVERKPVQDLPLNGRFFVNLVTLTTGAAPAVDSVQNPNGTQFLGARAGEPGVETNGGRPGSNNYTINGIDDEESCVANIVIYPPVDVIQEFRIQTTNQDAQFGKNPGAAINVVTRGGGNFFHGGAYEFLRNDKLDAANFFDPANKKPPFRMNQYGANMGGPIRKNKTFFFGYWEGERIRQAQTYVSTVPTAAEWTGNFSGLGAPIYDPATLNAATNLKQQFSYGGTLNIIPPNRLDTAAKNLTALQYPTPNLPGMVNNFSWNPNRASNGASFGTRIDHQISAKDNLFGQFMYQNFSLADPSIMPLPIEPNSNLGISKEIVAATEVLNTRGLMINENHMFTPTLVSDFRAGYTREWVFFANALLPFKNLATQMGMSGPNNPNVAYSGGLPGFTIGGYQAVGENSIQPFIVADNNFELTENMSWVKGKHNIQFGGAFIRRQYNFFQADCQRACFTFNGGYTSQLGVANTGNGYADFLLGIPNTSTLGVFGGEIGQRQWEDGLYVQDTWSVTHRLTLTMGVRYEILQPRSEIYNRQGNFDPAITGGAVAVASNSAPCGRALRCMDWRDIGPRVALAYKINSKTVLRTGFGIFYDDYAINGFGGTSGLLYDPPFFHGATVTNSITTPTITLDNGVPSVPTIPVTNGFVYPVAGVNYVTNYHDPHGKNAYTEEYNISLEREVGKDGLARVAYVGNQSHRNWYSTDINQAYPGPGSIASRRPFPLWGDLDSMIMNGQGAYNSLQAAFKQRVWQGLGFNAVYTYSHDITEGTGEWGNVQNYYDLQGSRGNEGWDQRQRFTLSGTYELPIGPGKQFGTHLTGAPAKVAAGWQFNIIYSAAGGFPFTPSMVADVSNTGRGEWPNRLCNGKLSNPTIHEWFNPACFTTPALYNFGNSGRGILMGPGTNEADFSVFKKTYINPDQTRYLEFRAEMFNLTNTPQFNNPNAGIGSASAGTISSAGTPANFSRTSRQIQLALKLYF